jgi:hypothetical protein
MNISLHGDSVFVSAKTILKIPKGQSEKGQTIKLQAQDGQEDKQNTGRQNTTHTIKN